LTAGPLPLRAVAPLGDNHDLEDFDCGVESLDRWLRQSARTGVAAGTSATYVLCRGDRVIGYYALAMASVSHAGAPSRLRRGMPDPVPVVLIARLALDRTEQGNALGGHLLIDALRRCVRGSREFGARAVIVDAIDDQAAAFYRHFDFHQLDKRRLWRRLSDVARAIEQ
jgi:predicted N-acetyltransferase YhbS